MNRILARAGEHRGLLAMAGSLFGTTVVTSALGFVYWWAAARLADPAMVGYATAAINAMQLAGTIGMLGLGSMLIGELEYGRKANPGLVSASIYTAALCSVVVAIASLAFFGVTSRQIFATVSVGQLLCFIGGAALTGGLVVLDQGMVGNGEGSAQLLRNTVFAVAKLGLIVVILMALPLQPDLGILLSWVAGALVSLAAVTLNLRRGRLVSWRPDFDALRSRWRAAMAHNAFNIASQFSRLTIPIIASTMISPQAGAAFFMAWMIANLAYIVPSHLSTALFAVGAGRLDLLKAKLRVSLLVSTAAGAVGVPVMILGAGLLMRAFGASYAEFATRPLQLLGVCYFLMVVKYHYIAVTRVENRLMTGAAMAGVGAVLDVLGALAGALLGGLEGLTIGFGIALIIQTAVMSRDVIRAATRATPVPVGA